MIEPAARRRPQVVVGVDGSPAARRTLAFAVREATLRDATLVAVMSVDLRDAAWLDPYALSSHPDVDQVARAGDELSSMLADVATAALRVHPIVTAEPAAAALVARSADADLLVVGSRARGGFRGMLLGSVSLQCVLHAHCPVTVVRSDPHPPPEQTALEEAPQTSNA